MILKILFFLVLGVSSAEAGGRLTGSVTLRGGAPSPRRLPVGLDHSVCGDHVVEGDLVVGKKEGVQNAVVFIRGKVEAARSMATRGASFTIDQKECLFRPRVLIVPAGQLVKITNSDGILHNFHTYSRANPPANRSQVATSSPLEFRFMKPEIFRYGCDLHPWMRGWVVVQENPYYALTNPQGQYELTDVPAGRYTIKVWHETLGEISKEVVLQEGEELTINFRYSVLGQSRTRSERKGEN